ncbi:C2H2-type zinc finger transcription factor [Mucor lusitanicus CBS 277.49]|uniref:C2H2-type zinc finger transcription factor n=1 Tax=Mucor lusitanicus CBS 277.49 TaxID=747725 RepID=A0A168MSA8_MUCCL|nr:C2H2-type zinc finger transcription factor [Mucor lusitanicus CBS 277.49]
MKQEIPLINSSIDDKSMLFVSKGCKDEHKLEHEHDAVFAEDKLQSSQTIRPNTSDLSKEPDQFLVKQENPEKREYQLDDVCNTRVKDYYYFCRLCKKKMPNLKVLLDHRRLHHRINGTSKPRIKHVELEPDIYDPNYYCNGCEKTLNSKVEYRTHLKTAHHMVLTPLPRESRRQRDSNRPDYNSGGFYCSLCSCPFQTQESFTYHCQHHHNIANPKLRGLPEEPVPYYKCQLCDATLTTRQKYRSHCYQEHEMRPIRREPLNKKLPNHCYICNRTYSETKVYIKHIYVIHNIDDEASNQPTDIQPDINDPNNYCRTCDKTLSSANSYRYHLLILHSIKDKYRKEKSALKPDVNDANHYCRTCDYTYSSKCAYRKHLRRVHQITVHRTITFHGTLEISRSL